MIADLDKRNEAVELWKKWNETWSALENAPADTDDQAYEELEAVNEAAADAYEAAGLLIENDNGTDIERCAITGVPLFVSDDVVMVLRSALPAKQEKAA